MRPVGLLVPLLAACTEYGYTPEDPVCVAGPEVAWEVTPTPDCSVAPAIGAFDPVVEWTWRENTIHPGVHQVDSQPVVANLSDDNADGVIDRHDVPDVVFNAFEGAEMGAPGAVVALSGANGEILWSAAAPGGASISSISGVAVGDLEGDGTPEVLVASVYGLVCLDHEGNLEWTEEVQSSEFAMPAIGDLEGDGLSEVVIGRTVVNHDGTERWFGQRGHGAHQSSFPVDLDGDGLQEVVAGNTIYEHDGAVRTEIDVPDGWAAIADFDLDGGPEWVVVAESVIWLYGLDGVQRWRAGLSDSGGGPPTIADYDGDGFPEIGIAAREHYWVVDTDGTVLWNAVTSDYSSAVTGSSVFDFEGDGAAEVVYADEHDLWIYDGATGTVELRWADHSSGTLLEYPVIVDLDADGSAEIVVASNDFRHGESHGITVIGDRTSSWAPARPIWNQHAYFLTNVDDDGRVPLDGMSNWTRWNSFRAGNSETAVGFDRPDVALGTPDVCEWECWDGHVEVTIPVENRGLVPVHELQVALQPLDGPTAGPGVIEDVGTLLPGETKWLGPYVLTAEDFGPDGLVIHADWNGTRGTWPECDETNNEVRIAAFPCEP